MDSVCDNAEQEKTLRTKKKERLADTEAHRHTHTQTFHQIPTYSAKKCDLLDLHGIVRVAFFACFIFVQCNEIIAHNIRHLNTLCVHYSRMLKKGY